MKLNSWSKSGGGECVVCEQAGGNHKEFCCANDYVVGKWPYCDAAYNIYSERLVFRVCSETNYPDESSVVVFIPSRQTLGSSLSKMA